MAWSIELQPLLPLPTLAIAVLLCLIAVALIVWRRSRGGIMRAASLAALLAALANPALRQEERQGLSNIALIAVDRSLSQRLGDRAPRTQATLEALKGQLAKLKNIEVRVVDAGKDARPEEGTALFGDIAQALTSIPTDRLAGVVVITDGVVHDAPATAAEIGVEAPVQALLTGAEGEFDRRIKVLKAPRFGIVGSSAAAEIVVEATGPRAAGGAAQLTIRREGEPDLRFAAAVGEAVAVPLAFPHAGANIVEVELAAVPGELTEANNRIILSAEGVRENLRVLLVSGEPHQGERTWRNLLKSDAAVDLVHFTILRPPQKQDGTPINELSLIAFPTRELFQEKLDEFDLIIFDRYERLGILPPIYIDNIARYVEDRGGAVLISAGDEYATPLSIFNSPLAAVLPADPSGEVLEEPFKPRLTDAGGRHPVTRGLPGSAGTEPSWGRWFRLVGVNQTRGNVLMAGPGNRPLLVLDRRGKGRVALMLSDHAWLWARGLEGGGPHAQLLRRLGHWLMKEPDLEEERLTARAEGLDIVIERRSMGETVGVVKIDGPAGSTREVALAVTEPGLWRATVAVEEPGFYRLGADGLEAVVLAGAGGSREMSEVTTTAAKLAPLLRGSGGGAFYTASRPGETLARGLAMPRVSLLKSQKLLAGSGWLGLRDREAYLTLGVRLYPLFTGLAALAALLGLVSLAWWREGR